MTVRWGPDPTPRDHTPHPSYSHPIGFFARDGVTEVESWAGADHVAVGMCERCAAPVVCMSRDAEWTHGRSEDVVHDLLLGWVTPAELGALYREAVARRRGPVVFAPDAWATAYGMDD